MKASDIFEAIGRVDDETILEVVSMVYKEKHGISGKKTFRTLLIAAVIVSAFAALGIAAYAGDFLGIRALLQDREIKIGEQELISVSITQPQQLPENIPENIRAEIQKSKDAWAEWRAFREANPLPEPEFIVKKAPEEYDALGISENGDGTYKYSFYLNRELVKEVSVSAEENKEYQSFSEAQALGYPEYDFSYWVENEMQAVKLKEIAEKYGLDLREEPTLVWSSDTTGQTGEGFYTNEELCAMTADMGNSGSIFRGTPTGFDKMYWYNEGSFGVSYYAQLPSGQEVCCYLRNSRYSTLTNGSEVGMFEKADESFDERSYTSHDGTKLSILSGENSAYIYTYLDGSYLVQRVEGRREAVNLSDEDLNFIADFINYSVIGKG